MTASKHDDDLAVVLREAIAASGLSMLQVSKRSGVPYASVHGFCRGDRDIHLSVVARLCRVVGLELRSMRKRRMKG